MTNLSSDKRNGQKIRVLICDDHDLIRQALRAVINAEGDMEIVGEASDGEEAVALANDLRPDAIVMDIQMPGVSGIEATKRIKESIPSATIIVLTVHESKEYILRILQAGAAGYLTKGIISKEIPMAIRSALRGECTLSEEILQKLVLYTMQFSKSSCSSQVYADLTDRELGVIQLAAKGLGNKSIAAQLNLTENTIKKYMMSIFIKLGVSTRTAMVVTARKIGILDADGIDQEWS